MSICGMLFNIILSFGLRSEGAHSASSCFKVDLADFHNSPVTVDGRIYKFLLVAKDHWSKFLILAPLKEKTGSFTLFTRSITILSLVFLGFFSCYNY